MIDQLLKERLTGAAVLIGVGVIFIPLFLDGPAQTQAESETRPLPVPAYEPASRPDAAPKIESSATRTQAESAIEKPPVGKESRKNATPPAEKPTKAKVIPEDPLSAWAVQVGSFSSQDNAERLRDQLKKKGYRAFVARHADGDRVLYRVRIGPEKDRERAEILAQRLKKDGEATSVVRHP